MTIRRDYDSGSMPLALNIKQTSTRDCRNGSEIYVFGKLNDIINADIYKSHFLSPTADTSFKSNNGRIALDSLVIIFSMIFIIMSGRSLINTLYLACRIARFLIPMMKNFHLKILRPLFSIWHIMVIVSNILAVLGSILKLLLSLNVSIPCFLWQ